MEMINVEASNIYEHDFASKYCCVYKFILFDKDSKVMTSLDTSIFNKILYKLKYGLTFIKVNRFHTLFMIY